jgi:hypothetical protein
MARMRVSLLAAVSGRGREEWVGIKPRSLALQTLANEVKGRKNFSGSRAFKEITDPDPSHSAHCYHSCCRKLRIGGGGVTINS